MSTAEQIYSLTPQNLFGMLEESSTGSDIVWKQRRTVHYRYRAVRRENLE